VFRPVALVEKYAPLGLTTCLLVVNGLSDYLPHVQHLAELTRFKLTSKVGRKTFVTLKIAQGVPRAQVMEATGHRTEASFNHYLGVVGQELVETFRKTARTVKKRGLAPCPMRPETSAFIAYLPANKSFLSCSPNTPPNS
jgi:hypothetical protein